MTRHVLVPLDGSDHGFAGLEYALESFPDVTLSVVHVIDPSHDHVAFVESGESPIARAEERGERILDQAVERGKDRSADVRTFLRTGNPHTEILKSIVEHDVDHVVLGSHGESPITRPFLGRISEAIVRRAPVSTTVIPEPVESLRRRELPGNVLVPTDGSEQAEAALAYTLETFPEGTHTALHVQALPYDRPRSEVRGTYFEEILRNEEARSEEILESATVIADELGTTIETSSVAGKPSQSIVEFAETNRHDQIVMGGHGRSLRARMITGSVAEKVVRRSPLPVTLFRGPHEEA